MAEKSPQHPLGPHGVHVETVYGARLTCDGCGQRWTIIRGDKEWVEETYSPMRENTDGG